MKEDLSFIRQLPQIRPECALPSRDPEAMAISLGVPRFYRGKRCLPLAPPHRLLKAKGPELFDREYRKQLGSLDAKQVVEDLGPNAIILCWDSLNVRCHRRLVAEWMGFLAWTAVICRRL